MSQVFEFIKSKPITLKNYREYQINNIQGPVEDFIEEGIVTYNADFIAIMSNGVTIGYSCIGTHEYFKDFILEYFLLDEYRNYSSEVLMELAENYKCKGWFVNTQDFFTLPLLLDLGFEYEIDAYKFSVDPSRSIDYEFTNNVTFKLTSREELQEVYNIITQDSFYTGGGIETLGIRLAEEELYSLREDGKLIGVGFISVLKRTPDFADIAMIIDKSERQKGWGVLMVRALIYHCRQRKLKPVAVCGESNKLSRRTLQTAGFTIDGCTLLAKFD